MTRPSDWCWCIWCWRRGSGGSKETREYRFGGTAIMAKRAFTVARPNDGDAVAAVVVSSAS